jgi:hypothetical protein
MKTTVDIPDQVLRQLKRRAVQEGTSLRALIAAALRQFLSNGDGAGGKRKPFKLEDRSVGGEGLQPGIEEGNWQQLSALIYEGRGG